VVTIFFFYLFFPRLISPVADWMSAIIPLMVWPWYDRANLGCRSEMWWTRLAEKYRTQKFAIWAPSHNFVRRYLRN